MLYKHRKYYSNSQRTVARTQMINSIPTSKEISHSIKSPTNYFEGAKVIFDTFMLYKYAEIAGKMESIKDKIREQLNLGESIDVTFEITGSNVKVISKVKTGESVLSPDPIPPNIITQTVKKTSIPKTVQPTKTNNRTRRTESYGERWERTFRERTGYEARYLGPDARFDRGYRDATIGGVYA